VSLADLPSIDRLLRHAEARRLVERHGRPLVLGALRSRLEDVRGVLSPGDPIPDDAQLIEAAGLSIEALLQPELQPVINASGVVLHTNLGRAPLSRAAQQAMLETAVGYSSLEFDLRRGVRGHRHVHAESLLCQATGAPAALVVNNNAAAVLLALTVLARGREVLTSRTQLIEIGGGFRIPDILKQSGARLVEVGTTNRTHLRDFQQAIRPRTALILRAHSSNFRLIGFATEPSLADLADLGRKHDLPVVDDLGSGALLDTAIFGLGHEPTVQESLQAGASLVAFSGDKLLGGPQAGILVGERELIEQLRSHPLARALRPDKLCLSALRATLVHYLEDDAVQQIPVWQMIAASPDSLRRRAEAWAHALGAGEAVPGRSTVGGGSLPEETLPTWLLAISLPHPNQAAAWLRRQTPPVVARIEDDRLVLDPRTVFESQEPDLLHSLRGLPTV
jgi:L-seryl-tRNA(Ser) seleniumtransferase